MNVRRAVVLASLITAVAACSGGVDSGSPGTSTGDSNTGGGDPAASGSSAPSPSSPLASPLAQGALGRATTHLHAYASALFASSDDAFNPRDVIVDDDGREHVRFDRTHRGLRVIGGDVVVHGRVDGGFDGASLALESPLAVAAAPRVGARDAELVAGSAFVGALESVGAAELLVYADGASPRLAYEVVARGILDDQTPSELHVVVDGDDGSVLARWDGVHTLKGTGRSFFSGTVALETTALTTGFELRDGSRGGAYVVDMAGRSNGNGTVYTDADNLWGNGILTDGATVAVDAHYGAATTWDYFFTSFGRKGIKNDGRGAFSRVHYGRKYNNAFWSDSCFCMTYGDGDGRTLNPLVALDVAGHEMSHGVTSATANLTYSGESGGLNEATSDIFGSMVEFFAQNPAETPDYHIGERLYTSGGRALRYMEQPSKDGLSPDCYSSKVARLDVHYSSGIGNHFFYLLAEGSSPANGPASPTCNGSTVVGIGRAAAAAIWYRALTVYMTSSTNYAGARAATLAAATDLYGAGSTQATTVAKAWSAVAVN